MSFSEEFSPKIVGADRLKLSLSQETPKPTALLPVIFLVDYSGARADGGIVLPLEMIVQAPTVAGYRRQVYTRTSPSALVYSPISSGTHLVLLREMFHNKFFGRLVFEVSGDPIDSAQEFRGPSPAEA